MTHENRRIGTHVYQRGEDMENHHFPVPLPDEGCRQYLLTVPDSGDWLAAILGAIAPLTYAHHYNPRPDGWTPAQEFNRIINDMLGEQGDVMRQKAGDIKLAAGVQGDSWLPCDGELYSSTIYPQLFAAIGTTFGSGGGDTFRVPDMRGRVPVGVGEGDGLTSRLIGDEGGSETHTLTIAQMPSHNHTVTEAFAAVTSIEPGIPEATAVVNPTTTGNTGGGESHNNMPPFLAVNYWIYTGIPECVPCEPLEIPDPQVVRLMSIDTGFQSSVVIDIDDWTQYRKIVVDGLIGSSDTSSNTDALEVLVNNDPLASRYDRAFWSRDTSFSSANNYGATAGLVRTLVTRVMGTPLQKPTGISMELFPDTRDIQAHVTTSLILPSGFRGRHEFGWYRAPGVEISTLNLSCDNGDIRANLNVTGYLK